MDIRVIIAVAVLVIAVILIINIIRKPMKFLFKLALNAVIGYGVLFLINYLCAGTGFAITINLATVLITGFLGLPGVILLVILTLM